jgi:hypothetical protein
MPDPSKGTRLGCQALRATVFAAGVMTTATAFAGGYETGERDWDFLLVYTLSAKAIGRF